MDRKWLPLNALRAFEAVGRHLSFTQGAAALAVSQSAVSRHVGALEVLAGHKLFERTPQGLLLTDKGAALLPAVTRAFDQIETVLVRIGDGRLEPRRTLKLHLPPSFLQASALSILAAFNREFPDILLDVVSTNSTGLPTGDYDLAVIYDRPRARPMVSDLLWMVRLTPVVSTEVAAAFTGDSMGVFLARSDLLHTKLEGQARGYVWTAFASTNGLDIDVGRGVAFDTAILAAQTAMAGGGVALADVDMFAEDLKSGRLVAPFGVEYEMGFGYFLVTRPEDLSDPPIALFRTWLIERFSTPKIGRPDHDVSS